MAINNNVVSVRHNGEFLPGIILLTQLYYHRGTRLNAMIKRFCICSLRSHPNVLTFSPLAGGCSEGLDAFRFFFKQTILGNCLRLNKRNARERRHGICQTKITPSE